MEIWAQSATGQQMQALGDAADHLTGGSAEFTPAKAQWAYGVMIDRGMVFSFPETVNGHPVLEGGLTKIDGMNTYVAFRTDVWQGIVAGDLGLLVGNLGFNVATVVGHEAVHLLGNAENEAQALKVKWGYQP